MPRKGWPLCGPSREIPGGLKRRGFNTAKGLAPLRLTTGTFPKWKTWQVSIPRRVGPFAARKFSPGAVRTGKGFNTAKGWPLCGSRKPKSMGRGKIRFNTAKGLAPLRRTFLIPSSRRLLTFQYRERVGPFAALRLQTSSDITASCFNTAKGLAPLRHLAEGSTLFGLFKFQYREGLAPLRHLAEGSTLFGLFKFQYRERVDPFAATIKA